MKYTLTVLTCALALGCSSKKTEQKHEQPQPVPTPIVQYDAAPPIDANTAIMCPATIEPTIDDGNNEGSSKVMTYAGACCTSKFYSIGVDQNTNKWGLTITDRLCDGTADYVTALDADTLEWGYMPVDKTLEPQLSQLSFLSWAQVMAWKGEDPPQFDPAPSSVNPKKVLYIIDPILGDMIYDHGFDEEIE